MKQKIITLIAAVGAMLGATTAFADEEKVGDYTWTYQIANGEAVITSSGGTFATYPAPVGDIQIPATLGGRPVTAVGNDAFMASDRMTGVTMPKSVRIISYSAFRDCLALANVTFGAMTTDIGEDAFRDCSSIKSLSLPDNVVDIASSAFNGCTGMTNLTVGAGTRSIGNNAFYGCSSLAKASLPRTLEASVDADPSMFGGCADGLKIEYYDVLSVTMGANGGVGGGDVIVRKGGTLAGRILPAATREGYAFAGWWTKKSGGTKLSLKTKFAKGAKYYAHWTPRKYAVRLTKSGKGSVSGAGSKAYRSKVTVKAKASKGYVFQGWYKITNNGQGIVNGGEGNGETLVSRKANYSFKVPLGGVTLKAKFITKAQDKAGIGMTLNGTGVGASAAAAGVTMPVQTNFCGVALSVPLAAEGLTPVKVTVKGLPKGFKYDAKKNAIVGVPRSVRTFTAKFTVKSAGASRTWSVRWVIAPLPAWAQGRYFGMEVHASGNMIDAPSTLSVTSSGKISGKLVEHGTNWTVNALCYQEYKAENASFEALVTATYAYKETKMVKGKKKTETKYLTREMTLHMAEDSITIGSYPTWYVFFHFGWLSSAQKALGKKYFYTSKAKPFRTFTIPGGSVSGKAIGLDPSETLTLKITPSFDVTAVMAFDTGLTTKNKKTGKMEKVIYKATCQTVMIPGSEDNPFAGELGLYFAPHATPTYEYPGYASGGLFSITLYFWGYGVVDAEGAFTHP